MASTMTRFDRSSLNIREPPIQPGSQESLEEETTMKDETEEMYVVKNIRSNMIDLNWSTHDFDPTRTTPPPPQLPSYKRHASILVIPPTEDNRPVGGQSNGQGQPNKDSASSPNNSKNNKSNKNTKNKKNSENKEKEKEKNTTAAATTKRYSDQPYVGGPCVVSNETLEELASHLFKRACVSMEELTLVDQVLQDEQEDRLIKEENEYYRNEKLKDQRNFQNVQNGTLNVTTSLLDSNFSAFTPQVVRQGDSKESNALQTSNAGSSLLLSGLDYSEPPSSAESSVTSSTSSTLQNRGLVSSIAMRARDDHQKRRSKQYKEAKKFISDMQDRAANINQKEFSNLRVSLLEQTYTWASSDQKQQLMAKKGEWQGNAPNGDTDLIELSSLPKMMVEGLKRTLSSRLQTPVSRSGTADLHNFNVPRTASSTGSNGSSRGSIGMVSRGSMGMSSRGSNGMNSRGSIGVGLNSRGGMPSRSGLNSRGGTAGSSIGSRGGTAGRLGTANSLIGGSMLMARVGTPTIFEEEQEETRSNASKSSSSSRKRSKRRKKKRK